MKNIKIIFPVLFTLLFSVVQAQKGETKFNIGYNVALPMNDFKNFVERS